MKITQVEIKNFKNLQDKVIELNGRSVVFLGNNAIGKTNTILAIYWCLTGSLLDNTQDNENLFRHFTTDPVNVLVKFDTGLTISRQLEIADDGKVVTNITVNGKTYGVKKAESVIDYELGLGLMALKDTKAIKVRRLLLNPLYINYIGNKDLRDYFSSLLGLDTLPKNIFDKLPEIEQNSLKEYITDYYDVADIAKKIKAAKTESEKKQQFWTVVCEYLNEYQKLNETDITTAQKNRDESLAKVLAFAQSENALKDYVHELTKAYDVSFKEMTGLNVRFIQETKTTDSYELIFTPIIDNKGTELSNGSTSEQVRYYVEFIAAIRKTFNLPELPIIVDETETFDAKNFENIIKIANTQSITARVDCLEDNFIHQAFLNE